MKQISRPYHEMLLYGSALLLLRGASLITLPVMTYFLSIEQIGQLELISVTQIFFSLLIALAMHENLYRFIATTQDANEQKAMTSKLYTTSLLLSCGLIIMVSGLFWTMNLLSIGAVKLQNFSDSQLVLMASAIAIQGSLEISLAWLRLQNQALTFFKISLICTCLQVGLILAVVSIIPSVTAVLAVGVFCAFVQMGLLHFYNRFSRQTLSLEQLKHYLRYCLPIMLSALVAFGLNGGERWLLAQSGDLAF
ncbi:oligosaccharide translocase SypK [Vibrio ponticus]|nr:oligosaccharide translocase SypK [Vibrio ponticus]